MNQPTTIKGKQKAWIAHRHLTAQDLANMAKDGKSASILDELTLTNVNMSDNPAWLQVGFAEVTLTLLDDKHVTATQLAQLQAQLQTVRAENQKRENAILDQISKLQAITYTPEA